MVESEYARNEQNKTRQNERKGKKQQQQKLNKIKKKYFIYSTRIIIY